MTAFRHPETGVLTLDLLNSGGSVALGTTFLFVSGSSVVRGRVGNFAADRRLVIQTTAPVPDVLANQAGGLVSCYEGEGRRVAQTYFLGSEDARRRYRSGRGGRFPATRRCSQSSTPTSRSTV
jgi:hypothetical protein